MTLRLTALPELPPQEQTEQKLQHLSSTIAVAVDHFLESANRVQQRFQEHARSNLHGTP
jgi:hypothetical protein